MTAPKKTHKNKRGNKRRASEDNPNRTIRTPEMREKILEHLAKTGDTITGAADALKIGRRTLYDWMKAEDAFRSEIDEVMMGPGADVLDQMAHSRAINGWDEPLTHQGQTTFKHTLVKVTLKNGKTKWKLEPIIDKKTGQPIPETVRKIDNGLLMKVLERRRPVKTKQDESIDSLAKALGALVTVPAK